jgi:hypothetical protein
MLHRSSLARVGGRALSLTLCGAFAALAACAGDKPPTVEERAAAFGINHDTYSRLGYRHQWSGFPVMSPGAQVREFDILGDALVVMDEENMLTVMRTSTGAINWSDQVGPHLTKFVGNIRDGNRLLVSSESDVFTYDIETSTLLDKEHLNKVVNTRPLQVGNILIYGTASGEIFGQIKEAGFRAWGNTIDGAIEIDPVLLGNTIGFVSHTGSVQFVDGVTGTTLGRNRIFDGPGADLAASETMMFVASLDRSLYAFDINGAVPRWRRRTDTRLTYPPIYHDGKVYCAIESAGMVCLDAATGREMWTAHNVSGRVVGVRHGRLLVWDGTEAILLDPTSGEVIDHAPLKNVAFLKTDKFVDGNVYAVSGAGVVAKFSPR